jgi:hypothetical protein
MDTEEKNYYITKNEREYGKCYSQLKWAGPEQAAAAEKKRGKINLNHHSPVYIEKIPVMRERRIPSGFPQSIPDELKRFEFLPEGLAEYY